MSYSAIHSCTLAGIQAQSVTVEVHISGGLPGMSLVGLPQNAVRESKDRIKAAIQHVGMVYPQVKIIVNLAPADLPKRGGRFDLPIALGVLAANGQISSDFLDEYIVIGELGLTGDLRSVSGVLPTAFSYCGDARKLLVPAENLLEAQRSNNKNIIGVSHLIQAVSIVGGKQNSFSNRRVGSTLRVENLLQPKGSSVANLAKHVQRTSNVTVLRTARSDLRSEVPATESSGDHWSDFSKNTTSSSSSFCKPDLADVKGQFKAKRALEIAAAGAHNLLMVGPPGTGKSMLAARLPGILPPMRAIEAIESACVASISASGFDPEQWLERPFRAPHHTASGVALVGGGNHPLPGEISLAHHGVLFLDELPEFSRHVLEVLREPLERGQIVISRAARQAVFPCQFQLIAAMNPCPCGYSGDAKILCRCGVDQIARYQSRISGPLIDRIDLHVNLTRETSSWYSADEDDSVERSDSVRDRVTRAREQQLERQACANAMLASPKLKSYLKLSGEAQTLLQAASSSLDLSLRVQHRVLKVSRTIADLAGANVIEHEHVAEAINYRPALNGQNDH